MKYLIVLLMVMVMLTTGCATLTGGNDNNQMNISPETQKIIMVITARRIGSEVAKKYPQHTDAIIKACDDMIAAESNIDEMIRVAVENALPYITADPIMTEDVKDIVDLLLNMRPSGNEAMMNTYISECKIFVKAFLGGIKGGKLTVTVT